MNQRRNRSAYLLCLFALLAGWSATASAYSGAATTTTLALTSGGSTVSSATAGSLVTLTATVMAGSSPVTIGQVNFCDASALRCMDSHLLGIAQLTSAGVAVLNLRPGAGAKSYKAIFVGTSADSTSTSSAVALTVTGTSSVTTTLVSSGTTGNYSLTATVGGSGVTPTGSVSFLDTSNSNFNLGTATLGSGSVSETFTPQTAASTVSFPGSPVTGDFNGDGIPDLAMASGGLTAIQVFLGKADGTFQAGVTYPTGPGINYPADLAAGDFNHDGILDLVGVGVGAAVYLGNGDGTFNPVGAAYSLSHAAVAVKTGDFNGDGLLDLAVTTGDGSSVDVLLGNGDGTFAHKVSYTTGVAADGIVATDFSGDGVLDLVVSSLNGNNVVPLLGVGDGSFIAQAPIPVGSFPFYFASADFNGDGIADVAVAAISDNVIDVLLSNGDGTFQSPVPYSVTGQSPFVMAGDFNGDGISDLAVTQEANVALEVFLGNGDGTFQAAVGYPGSDGSTVAGAVADFNGDGLPDVVAISAASKAYVMLNQFTNSASATLSSISPIGSGTHQVKASYAGDTNYPTADSSSVALTAQEVATSLTLAAAPTSSTLGQQVMLSATLSPFNGQDHSTDGETVTFYDTGSMIGTGTLSSGVATLNITSLSLGTRSLTAQYADDTNFLDSTTATELSFVVSPAVDTVTVNAAGMSYGSGTISLSATITYPAGGTPSGVVTFTVDSGAVVTGSCTGAVSPLSCTAVYSVGALSGGPHVISVSQAADTNHSLASGTGTLTVNPITPSISVSPASSVYSAASTTLSASVTYAGAAAPTGAVIFMVDTGASVPATCTGSTSPLSCSASYPTSAVLAGPHSITASLGADANYNTTSGGGTLTVTAATPNVAWTPASSIVYGTDLTGIATATASLNSNPVAGTFTYTATPMGGSPTAVTATTVLHAGSYTLTAQFAPVDTSDYNAPSAVQVSMTVTQAPQTINFAQPTSPVQFGNVAPVALGATATSGLGITYRVIGPGTITAGILNFTGVGVVTITASQSGNADYAVAAPVTQSVTVEPGAVTDAPPGTGALSPGGTATMTVTLHFHSSFTLAHLTLMTPDGLGSPFTIVPGGTCEVSSEYSAGGSCTVKLSNTAGSPGAIEVSVQATDVSGTIEASGTAAVLRFR